MRLSEIKTASLADLHYAAGKAIFAQGNGPAFSQMLENRLTAINKEIAKRAAAKTKKRPAIVPGIVIALLLISINCISQPFLGLSVNNKGAGFQLGCVSNNLELKAAYKVPFMQRDVPTISSFSIGKIFFISNKESDNYAIIPEIGCGYYRVKDFSGYDADPTGKTPIVQITGFKPVYGLSLTKDAYLGQLFISANHAAGGFYYSVGMKFFFYR